MEASTSSGGRIGGKWSGGAFSGRRTGIYVAVAAALLAGVLIYAFVQHYKNNVTPTATSNTAIVATSYIPRGTPASMVAANNGWKLVQLKSGSIVGGAISSPTQIANEVAATNIAPGQELTSADFATGTVSLSQYLVGGNRAIEIPVDSTHGLAGYIVQGQHIDLGTTTGAQSGTKSRPGIGMLATNVLVLDVGANGASLVLELPEQLALKVAYAADNGSIWVLARPPAYAGNTHGAK